MVHASILPHRVSGRSRPLRFVVRPVENCLVTIAVGPRPGTPRPPVAEPIELAARVLHDPRPASASYSGETFSGLWFRQRAYVRFYLAQPERAAIDLAIMRRLDGHVPLPKVLTSSVHELAGLPPHIVTEAVGGQRADVVLRTGLTPPAARALGRQCARVVAVLRAQSLEHSGPLADPSFAVGTWPRHQRSLRALYTHLKPSLETALGADRMPALRSMLAAADARLAAGDDTVSLVHGDLSGKNLIVDGNTGRLRAVLDWECAHAGDWATDLGNLMRGVDEAAAGGPNAEGYTAYRQTLVDGVHENLYAEGRLSSLGDQRWLLRAADLDLFGVLELAARPEPASGTSDPVRQARTLLLNRLNKRANR
jgi:aminoglycoside phosphotransferase (APT) family kinase protein